jgi:serine/threonine protein kinase
MASNMTDGTGIRTIDIDSRYKILGPFARGGMSDILKAWDEEAARTVAIKVLHKELIEDNDALQRFLREGEALRHLNHPNIAQVFESGITPSGQPYIVMEFIEGQALEKLIHCDLSQLEKIDLMLQACHALSHAHHLDTVHRDIKPGNLVVSKSHQLKIVDFGLAKILWDDGYRTTARSVLGTPCYMSPEQTLGQGADNRSDIYSLGATFYHLFAGKPPFEAESSVAVMMKHASAPLIAPDIVNPAVSPAVSCIITKMMAKDPLERYAEIDSVIAELEAAKLGQAARSSHYSLDSYSGEPENGLPPVENEDEEDIAKPSLARRILLYGGILLGCLCLLTIFVNEQQQPSGMQPTKRSTNPSVGMLQQKAANKEIFQANLLRMRQVVDAVNRYNSIKGSFPNSIVQVEKEQLLSEDEVGDYWGYRISFSSTLKKVISKGEDGEEGTADDWGLSMEGQVVDAPQDFWELEKTAPE